MLKKFRVSKEEYKYKFRDLAFRFPDNLPEFIELEGEEIIIEECNHEYGSLVYLSNPPQYKCQKCGKFTYNKLETEFDIPKTKHTIPWKDIELSYCCGAIKDVVHGDESTNYYACSFCGKEFISRADYRKPKTKKIEKIKMNINDQYFRSNDELARKLNEVIKVVNNLLEK